jgi:glutamate--glyoxylate aminotransferase
MPLREGGREREREIEIERPLLISDPELIFLTDGASKGVMQLLNVIIRDEKDGVRNIFCG